MAGGGQAGTRPLVTSPGDCAIIPGWRMQSTKRIAANLSAVSQPGTDVSSWYAVSSRATVFAGLLENGVYDETSLFFSDNLATQVDYTLFDAPWAYRQEFQLEPSPGQHYFVQTNGVTSCGDVYLNGMLVASKDRQVGAYGGQKYEVTEYLKKGVNALLINAYPTNYLRDFAIGFVDWNPYPPDNGTGVWRNVEFLQSGPVSISPPRILTDFREPTASAVNVTIKVDLYNLAEKTTSALFQASICTPDGSEHWDASQQTTLEAHEKRTISVSMSIENPQIWWPSTWGSQPLYTVSGNVTVAGVVSDVTQERSFGIRHTASQLNAHNDTAFTVNGQPFLVMGAGYTPDIFMRFDLDRVAAIFQNVLDLGLNTIRLEGKQEQPEFYDLADRMGLMVMSGWECCGKWEGWKYNDEANGVKWTDADYPVAETQMAHEAAMMQSHPSLLAFLIGSDYWPDDRAAKIYVDALHQADWPNPIISSAAQRGFPAILGPSGMKMPGPYDWVSPNYWYGDQLGAAFGFGSELGSGVGTPELPSLERFLSSQDLTDLWTKPNAPLFHMSEKTSQFTDRSIYDGGLYGRYGKPNSIDDYLLKAQIMDYEATRAQFEGYAGRKSAERPATGLIYWMLNGAWPNLHWQLFDYYLKGAGSYYGTKIGTRMEHAAYDYDQQAINLISHTLSSQGTRHIFADLIDPNGKLLSSKSASVQITSNAARQIFKVPGISDIEEIAFLKLVLRDASNAVLSRNVYWLSRTNDVLDWKNSTWYNTPVTHYADLTGLFQLKMASVTLTAISGSISNGIQRVEVVLENKSSIPAFFLRLGLLNSSSGQDEMSAHWSDNYLTLWPYEKLTVSVDLSGKRGTLQVTMAGSNVVSGSTYVHT